MDDLQPPDFESRGSTQLPHVLTITPFYPIEEDDARGCFVAESLAALQAIGVQNTVIGVQPFYRRRIKSNHAALPVGWRRFFTFPGGLGLPSSGAFLFSTLLSEVRELHRRKRWTLYTRTPHSPAVMQRRFLAVNWEFRL